MVIQNDDHPNKTLEKLNFQRLTCEFTDLSVTVAGQRFSLHKSLLAAYSSLFCSVLQDVSGIGQAGTNINLDGVEAEYFDVIILYIYTSRLDVTPANVEQLQTAAEFLQVQDVIDLCIQYKKQKNEELAAQSVQNIKMECFIEDQHQVLKQTKPDESTHSENVAMDALAGQEAPETSVEEKKMTSMMVEVYGSKDEVFGLDDEMSKQTQSDEKEMIPPEINEVETKVKRRGRKPTERVICEVCNKSFTRPRYEVHKRLHTGEKPFRCSICDKRFASIYNLRVHNRIHTGEKPFTCKLCNKAFSDPSTVRKHVLWHEGIKKKRCDICGKFFSTLSQVKEHRRSHTKEKPYVCGECGKAYGYRCDYKRHMREHTGDMIGPCSECGKYFNHRSNFLSHLKSHARKSNSTQLKLQGEDLLTTDGRVILNAKICDRMFVLPSQDSDNTVGNDITIQQAIANSQSVPPEQVQSDDGEIEVTMNDGKFFVKHSSGSQNGGILDGSQIILKDEELSVSAATTSDDQQTQVFEEQCGATLSADQVIMLVQHAQDLEMPSASIGEEKPGGSQVDDDDQIILSNDDETLVVVDGTI